MLFNPDINLDTKESTGTIDRIIGTGRAYLSDKQGRVLKRLREGDEIYRGVWIRAEKGVLLQLKMKSHDGREARMTVQPGSCVMFKPSMPDEPLLADLSFGRLVARLFPESDYSVETNSDVTGIEEPWNPDGAPAQLDLLSPEERREYREQLLRAIRLDEVDALQKQVRTAATAATEAGLQNSAAAALQTGCRIETPNARVDSTGGVYGVEYNERVRITKVEVQEGSVAVQAKETAGDVLPLQAGEQVAVRDQGMDQQQKITPEAMEKLAKETGAGDESGAPPTEPSLERK